MEENKKKALDESQLDEVAGGLSFTSGLRNVKKNPPMNVAPTSEF